MGLHWNGNIGDTQLELLGIAAAGHGTRTSTRRSRRATTNISILPNIPANPSRASTLRYAPIENLTLEGGSRRRLQFPERRQRRIW